MRYLILLFFCTISSCSSDSSTMGMYKGVIHMQDQNLPFNFSLEKKGNQTVAYLKNASENLLIENTILFSDSMYLPMHIFDAYLTATISEDTMRGVYNKSYRQDYILPFRAFKSTTRFEKNSIQPTVTGRYKVVFREENGHSYPAIGIFNPHQGDKVAGTFLTETGDFRFLEGIETSDSVFLSGFDGEHLFLFKARKFKNDSLSGGFWSGSHYYAGWNATRDSIFQLADADSLTYLRSPEERFDFAFPTPAGDTISLSSFKGNPVIVQILGSWCPNCMDETKFLSKWRKENPSSIQVIGLAFEQSDDFDYAADRVNIMTGKLQVPYPILIAGHADKTKAARKLPMLNSIISFPTTIFLDRNHSIIRIHTGFSGPGTGQAYDEFVRKFSETTKLMLQPISSGQL